MTDYQFDSILVADNVTFQRAANASVTVYDSGDTANSAPLALKDLNGLPLTNPLTSTAEAFIPAFTASSSQVKLVGAGLTVYNASYQGLADEASAAKEFVQGIGVAAVNTGTPGSPAAVSLDANGQFTFTVPRGQDGAQGLQGPEGLPGVNAVPADAAVAGYVGDTTPSSSRAAVDSAIAAKTGIFVATSSTATADVNAWLAAPSYGPKRLQGTLTLTAPLVIPSSTWLDASGATITSTFVGNMIQNANCASTTTRDSNIIIHGGTWQRNAGGPGGGSGNGWANSAHSIFLRHVDNLLVGGFRVSSTGGKYMIAIGDVTNFYVGDIAGTSVASDTVHLTGPCSRGVVERIHIDSGGDDCVAFTTTDYVSYDDVHGPFSDIAVRDVSINNTTRCVLLGGSASGADDGFGITGITIDNAKQLGTGVAVWTGGPYSTAKLTDLTCRNIDGTLTLAHKAMGSIVCENTGIVNVTLDTGATTTAIDRLVIRNPKQSTASYLTVNNPSITVDRLEVDGARLLGSSLLSLLQGTVNAVVIRNLRHAGAGSVMGIGCTVGQITIDGMTGTVPSGFPAINLNSGAVVGAINVLNANYTAGDTSSGALVSLPNSSTATLKTLNVSSSTFTAIKNLLDVGTGVTAQTIMVNLANLAFSGCNRIIQAGVIALDVSYANISAATMVNQPFRIFGGGAMTIRGHGWRGYTGSAVINSAGEIIHVVSTDLPADLSILAKANGDNANNTNAALACGVGPAYSNGTNWKNLYSGATY